MKIIHYFIAVFLLTFGSSLQAISSSSFSSHAEAEAFLNRHYNLGCQYYNQNEWFKASREFALVAQMFPTDPEIADTYYFLGVSYFQIKDYDFANWAFSNYLKASESPKFFEDVLQYKFCIAESFKSGYRRRLFRARCCPNWFSARTLALSIYDEIIMAVPNHSLAAASLYSKGTLLQSMRHYPESIEAFQMLIRRFPKHELAPQSYLKISEVYCQRSQYERHNSDLLVLAEINLKRFKEDFSKDEFICLAEGYVERIKENSARGLTDIGLFYERVGRPAASVIYYQTTIQKYPTTEAALFCQYRLNELGEVKGVLDSDKGRPPLDNFESPETLEMQMDEIKPTQFEPTLDAEGVPVEPYG